MLVLYLALCVTCGEFWFARLPTSFKKWGSLPVKLKSPKYYYVIGHALFSLKLWKDASKRSKAENKEKGSKMRKDCAAKCWGVYSLFINRAREQDGLGRESGNKGNERERFWSSCLSPFISSLLNASLPWQKKLIYGRIGQDARQM